MIDFNKIERIREDKKISQEKLAGLVGLSRNAYRTIIERQDVRMSLFVKICDKLKISPWDVWKGVKPVIDLVNDPPAAYGNPESEQLSILKDSLKTKNELIERLKEENRQLKAKIEGSKTKQV